MHTKHFAKFREELGKTQQEMGYLLGISVRAVRSYEQGWRPVPVHVERQMLFLIGQKRMIRKKPVTCWTVKDCPEETRSRCPAWEFSTGDMCWFVNGTICEGEVQASWKKKMKTCTKCPVFLYIFET